MVSCHNATLLLHLHGRACASVQHVNERAMLNCLSVGGWSCCDSAGRALDCKARCNTGKSLVPWCSMQFVSLSTYSADSCQVQNWTKFKFPSVACNFFFFPRVNLQCKFLPSAKLMQVQFPDGAFDFSPQSADLQSHASPLVHAVKIPNSGSQTTV